MDTENHDLPGALSAPPRGAPATLSALLDALGGDRDALIGIVDDFLAVYPKHLKRISAAVRAGNAQQLEKSAHQFKGILGIFSRSAPLALTQRLIDMGERGTLTEAPQTLELLKEEMRQLALSLREFTGRRGPAEEARQD
jgi:HPt (histidine-containing phosphotransfer) domain-containing protein